tara:strand:- start:4015 stop:4443 length:429 start_codon:yes stop_codon:yes gene_type:complete
MSGGGIFQKPNVGGMGVGVRPSNAMTGLSINTTTTKTPPSLPGMSQNVINSGEIYSAADIAALKLEYDTDEALRQDKLDRMSQLAQGKGGSGGGVSASKVGNAGNLDVEHTPMMRGEDGFPTLADFEQPLHPFLGKRRQRYS